MSLNTSLFYFPFVSSTGQRSKFKGLFIGGLKVCDKIELFASRGLDLIELTFGEHWRIDCQTKLSLSILAVIIF